MPQVVSLTFVLVFVLVYGENTLETTSTMLISGGVEGLREFLELGNLVFWDERPSGVQ
jgi:hypothetical protein